MQVEPLMLLLLAAWGHRDLNEKNTVTKKVREQVCTEKNCSASPRLAPRSLLPLYDMREDAIPSQSHTRQRTLTQLCPFDK